MVSRHDNKEQKQQPQQNKKEIRNTMISSRSFDHSFVHGYCQVNSNHNLTNFILIKATKKMYVLTDLNNKMVQKQQEQKKNR